MLGISFGEIMIIGTIGLIVIGPKRLPETARFLGHLFGRLQRQVNSVKADIRREMAMEDMKNIQREYEDAARDMRNAFDKAADGVPPPETLLNSSTDNTTSGTEASAETATPNTATATATTATDTEPATDTTATAETAATTPTTDKT